MEILVKYNIICVYLFTFPLGHRRVPGVSLDRACGC